MDLRAGLLGFATMMQHCRLLLATCALASCGSRVVPAARPDPTGPATSAAPAPQGAGASPWDAPRPATPSVAPGVKVQATPEQAAQRAIARLPQVERRLGALRGQPFRQPTPAAYQPAHEFRAFVQHEVDKELTPQKAQGVAAALLHLGLLSGPTDLRAVSIDAMASQAAAYYDPAQRKFFVVIAPDDDTVLDTITSHELTHALQDQYFDLRKYLETQPALHSDAANARRFVVEGEATFTMFAYLMAAKRKTETVDAGIAAGVAMAVKMSAPGSIADLRKMAKSQVMPGQDAELSKAAEAMDRIPAIMLVPMVDSYLKGASAIADVFAAGGWAGVYDLYAHPPQSTEQMLHPKEKLVGTRDVPTEWKAPTLPNAELLDSDVLGELGWRVYFEENGETDFAKIAAGWDGDRYAVWRLPTEGGALVSYVGTIWDTEADAKEFADAYRRTLVKRFGGDGSQRPSGARISVVHDGVSVTVLDGGATPAAHEALRKKLTVRLPAKVN